MAEVNIPIVVLGTFPLGWLFGRLFVRVVASTFRRPRRPADVVLWVAGVVVLGAGMICAPALAAHVRGRLWDGGWTTGPGAGYASLFVAMCATLPGIVVLVMLSRRLRRRQPAARRPSMQRVWRTSAYLGPDARPHTIVLPTCWAGGPLNFSSTLLSTHFHKYDAV